MSNADIFGYQESVSGEIDGNRVLVKKRHQRSVRDAAVPPGQSINFEFYVAAFPFELIVTDGGAGIGTTARTTSSSSGGSRAGVGGRRAAAAARVASAAATSRSRAGRRVSDRGAASTSSGPLPVTIAARRRPMGPWEPGLGDLVIDPEPPPPPPDWEVPFEITLTPPNGLAALVYTRPKSSEIRHWPTETARIDPLYLERGRGRWQISVKNINDVSKRIEILLESIHAITPISQQDIPLSLLNFLSSVALQKASPTIRYINGDVVVMTPSPFLDLMGVDRTLDLPSVVGSVVESLPTYTPISAQLMSRTDFIARIEDRKTKINEAFIERIQRVGPGDPRVASWNSDRQNAIDACDASIRELRNLSDELAAYCLVLEGMFTNPEVDLRYIGTVAEIDNQIPQIGLVFDRWLGCTRVISNLAVDLSPLLSKIAIGTAALALLSGPVLGPLAILGGVLLYNSIADVDVEEKIRLQIWDRREAIAGYVRRALERITDLGAVALDAQVIPDAAADGSDVLRIRYFNPSTARPPRPMRPIDGAIAPINEVLEIGNGDVEPRPRLGLTHVMDTPRSARRGTRAIAREVAPDDGPLIDIDTEPAGQLPPAFVVQDPETLARLDDHECIAIVMMENRSFDHFFYDLSTVYPGRGYQAVPASYRNPPPPGFGEPMMPIRNTSIGLGNNLIFLPGSRSADPNHNKEHTYFQLGGGTEATQGTGDMLGFAADFAKESDSPQIVMSYLALDDLPVLKAVAGQYPVCDRWFAALPVGTYPNRLSSLQGTVPFLHNIHMDDPALGYLEDYSIFDLLDSQRISWKFFESDIGTIRLYDRYRLNVDHVRPISELDSTLQAASQGVPLPRVMFIEPAFLFGNDDHPPMDVQQGQEFLRQVLGKFIEHDVLDRTLFVITYDEHGGFFDHIPPPGTPKVLNRRPRRVDDYGTVESLFPQDPTQAPTSLGVRVPSLVLSRWTTPRANHTILDHTAILKTILLHNRGAIATDQFSRFGARVEKRGHLGQLLDRTIPRRIDYPALSAAIGYHGGTLGTAPAVVSADMARLTPSHPGNVLRGIALPRPRQVVM